MWHWLWDRELFGLAASFLPNHILFFLAMFHSHTHSTFLFFSPLRPRRLHPPSLAVPGRTGPRWEVRRQRPVYAEFVTKWRSSQSICLTRQEVNDCYLSFWSTESRVLRQRERRKTPKTTKTERWEVCHHLRWLISPDGAKGFWFNNIRRSTLNHLTPVFRTRLQAQRKRTNICDTL